MKVGATIDLRRAVRQLRSFDRAFNGRKILGGIGLRHLAWMHQNVKQEGAERRWQGLKASTKWAKQQQGYGTKAGVMTGKMKQSFASNVAGDSVVVGTPAKTATWFHGGTRAHKITPKSKKALRWPSPLGAGGFAFAKVVNHPGQVPRPLLPTKVLGEKLAVAVVLAAAKRAAAKAGVT